MEMDIPVNIETVEAEIQMELEELPEPEMIASVEDIPEPEMEMPEPEVEKPQLEEVKETPTELEETVDEQPEEETTEPDEKTNEEPIAEDSDTSEQEETKEQKEKPVDKPTKKEPSAKEKAATKIVKKIDDKARYDDAAQTKTLIVMQILGNTKTFFDTQSMIVDTNVNQYLNKTIEDNYGVLFDMAQQQTIDDMINSQWQK